MSRIDAVFQSLSSSGRMAFIPFVTAGDPDLAVTSQLVRELARRGADLIEIGFPYSDPIADGPVIQASYTRALNKKLKLKEIFTAIGAIKNDVSAPLVGMVSYAIIFRHGPTAFVTEAAAAGFAGLIVPDLPGDEAMQFAALAKQAGLDLIQLVAPTTPADRIEKILQSASGFIYCIAVAGTTGVREALTADLHRELGLLREKTHLPLCVGFGISRPEQIHELRGKAQGVIVGSAVVRHLEPLATHPDQTAAVIETIGQYAESMAKAAHQPG